MRLIRPGEGPALEEAMTAAQLETIKQLVIDGDEDGVAASVRQALEAGLDHHAILHEALIPAMAEVGSRFEAGDYYVPEMLVAALAMQAGLALVKPHLAAAGGPAGGRAVIGTVQGDLHDIGKNLVAMMLEGAGFEITDLGTDVAPASFVATVRETRAQVVALSALLTTTMMNMKAVVEALKDAGLRDQVKVIVGGAPLSEQFARDIGADGYAPDASRAVRLARDLVSALA
jgi:5-methyltetrahydrofolate--homocysteine methyltransferase